MSNSHLHLNSKQESQDHFELTSYDHCLAVIPEDRASMMAEVLNHMDDHMDQMVRQPSDCIQPRVVIDSSDDFHCLPCHTTMTIRLLMAVDHVLLNNNLNRMDIFDFECKTF